jgi:hypothetical protein
LNVRGVNDVGQSEMYTAASPVPEPSTFEVEMAIEKLKRDKLPGIDQIPAELIKARGRTIRSEIRQLIHFILNEEDLCEQWKKSIILGIRRATEQIVVFIETYPFCQLHIEFCSTFFCKGELYV